jgi:hypothetical protein
MRLRQYSLLTLAGTAALAAAGSVGATALPVPAAQAFYFSGSTAMDNPLKALFLDSGGICSTASGNTIDVYTDNSSGAINGGHNNMVVCKLSTAIGSFVAGTTVAFDKESNGGSLEGAVPVANGSNLTFFSSTTVPTCTGGPTTVAAGAQYAHAAAYTVHFGCTPNASLPPQIGIADENLEVFNIGSPQVTNSIKSKLKYTQFAQNVFGIGVSLDLFRALQRAQGLTSTGTANDSLANRPTLSSAVIRNLYTGAVTSWANISDSAGNAINSATDNGGTAVSPTVYLCRRGQSSGTESSVDIRFIGNRCTQSAAEPLPIQPASTSSGNCTGQLTSGTAEEYGCAWNSSANSGDVVFAGFGGGDVASCLSYHDSKGQFAIGNLTTNQAEADLNGAGGTGDTNSSTNGRFRFVKIDGKSPDLGSVVNGQYDYVFDNIMVTQNNSVAERDALVTFLLQDFFKSSVLAESIMNTQPGDTNFTAGVLMDQLNSVYSSTSGAPAANATPPYVSGAAVASGAGGVTPVSPFTFLAVDGTNPQNCVPPAVVVAAGNSVPTNP